MGSTAIAPDFVNYAIGDLASEGFRASEFIVSAAAVCGGGMPGLAYANRLMVRLRGM